MPAPNIILINCDDLGYGDLGCYGSELHSTPHIDRMAAEGMRFTDFYMPASVCSPSRGGMLTGCYPPRVGFGWFENRWVLLPGHPVGLNPEEITVARLLQGAGYDTKLVGKWHCGDQEPFLPTEHGFDSYYGLPYSNDMGRQRPPKDFQAPPLPLMRDTEVVQEQPDQAGLTERYVEEAVRFLRQPRANPFFLYFAHMYVHGPRFVPPVFQKRSRNGNYGAAVECIDWATGAILDELERQGLAENTLVIFTSDNGSGRPESNAPLRGRKGTTWEGGMRLPCIMRWPGRINAGSVCNALTSAMDFYPTLSAVGGADVPDDRVIDGHDIRSLMFGESEESPYEAFFYYMSNRLEAVRKDNWKLHVGKKFGNEYRDIRELYDLDNDPGESNNLYDDRPEIVAELSELLQRCRQDIGDEATGIEGENVRPVGRVSDPDTLTHHDPDHPYIIEEYDLNDQ
ncbi:MAG: sulfatase [Planctomycetota bacterium]